MRQLRHAHARGVLGVDTDVFKLAGTAISRTGHTLGVASAAACMSRLPPVTHASQEGKKEEFSGWRVLALQFWGRRWCDFAGQ